MKLALWLATISAAAAQQHPTLPCEFDGFHLDSKMAEVKVATTGYYACATGKCLPMTLKPGDPVVIARAEGAWTCGYLVARKGSAPGWVESANLRQIAADPDPPLSTWLGEWRQGENRIDILPTNQPGKVELEGDAYWHGIGDNVHTGSISGDASPSGNRLHYAEEDVCTVDLALIGKYLLAIDNAGCGGANVRFWGVWKRAQAPAQH